MATQTPNLGLTLPVGSENVSRQVINGNNTLIDTFAGNVNTAMDQMGSNLGILETGDTATHAIAKGEYVTWKGASYTADAAISIGETLAATGGSKNLTACDKGIANALNSNSFHQYDTNEKIVGSFNGNDVYEKSYYGTNISSQNIILDSYFDPEQNTFQVISINGGAKLSGQNQRPINIYLDSSYKIQCTPDSNGLTLSSAGYTIIGYFVTIRYMKGI